MINKENFYKLTEAAINIEEFSSICTDLFDGSNRALDESCDNIVRVIAEIVLPDEVKDIVLDDDYLDNWFEIIFNFSKDKNYTFTVPTNKDLVITYSNLYDHLNDIIETFFTVLK